MVEKLIQSRKLNVILTILLLALWLRLINLNQSLWLDEAAQALESAKPFGQQWQIPYDFHPPLYHYVLHLWMDLGLSEWVMRLSSVIPGVGTVGLMYLIGKELRIGGRESLTGTLTALFLAIAPYHIYYSQELRMYSLATFWAALLIYSFLKRNRWLHTLAAICGIYTLYLFPLMLVAEGLYLLFHEGKWLGKWTLSMMITGMAFLPWLPMLREQMQNGFNLPEVWHQWRLLSSPGFLRTIPLTFAKFALGRITFENKLVYGSLVTLAAGVFLTPLVKSFQGRISSFRRTSESMPGISSTIWLVRYWLFAPLILAWIISVWIPLNGPWRLLFTLPALYLLIAQGIAEIESLKLRRFLISGITGLSLLGVILYHDNPQYHREDWKTAVKAIYELSVSNRGAVVFAFPEPFAPYRWYAPNLKNAVAMAEDLRVVNLQELQDQRLRDEDVIYYFEYLSELSDPERFIPAWFERQGYRAQQVYDFRGVGFVYEYRL